MKRPVPRIRFRQGLTTLCCLALAAGCSTPETDGSGREADGALRGELVTYVMDFDDHSETQHLLRLPSGEEKRLIVSGDADLAGGGRVRVWGSDLGDSIAVTRFEREPAPEVEAHRSALIDGKKKPPKRWAFVLVDTGKGVNLTQQAAMDRLFSTTNPKSMKNYYKEISFGLQELDGQVFGPLPYQPASACDSSGVAKALRPMVEGTFDQYLWYFGTRQQCDWAGLAALGTADRPQRDSWYNASSGCVVLAQEPGHNFGMVHSSSLSCTNAGGMKVPFAAPGQGTCIHSEYGNIFDPMGGGNTCYHMDGFQKAYQDWLTGCNVVKASTSGTFTIFPLEKACNGVQLLQIPFGENRTMMLTNGPTVSISNYYLELRAPIGVDAALTPRVFVTVGGNIAEARGRGGRNWLLDMTTETTTKNDAALPVGRMYADPGQGGPKFTVVSADATKAVIRVEVAGGAAANDAPGAGTCDDGTPFQAPGPDTCDAPPVSAPPTDGGAGTTPDARPRTPDSAASGGTGGGMEPDNNPGGSGGAGGSGAGGPPDAGTKPGGGETPPPTEEEDAAPPTGPREAVRGSCSCDLGAASATGTGAPLFLLLAGAFLIVRRRRS
jgi:hypothetical protein